MIFYIYPEGHQKPYDVGQNVACDISKGLVCWNKENRPEECYDYEIRFFCPCRKSYFSFFSFNHYHIFS